MSTLPRLLACSLLLTCACTGGGSGNGDGTDGGQDLVDGGADTADAAQGDFVELITGTWEKQPGSDSYWCTYKTVTEDMYITGFEAIAPLGTHHTVLGIAKNYNGPDKEVACGVQTVGEELLYASGVGTDTYSLPEGVALKVPAGQTILLQLHLFNVSDNAISGTSGTRVSTIPESEVQHLAEFMFAGTLDINIPGNGEDTTLGGSCTMTQDVTIFTLWPHMHQIGKHMKIDLNGTTLHDLPYSFEEQKMYPMDSIEAKAGDVINVTCTYNNPLGNATKTFGDGSNDEMCFGGIYRYPALGTSFGGFCLN